MKSRSLAAALVATLTVALAGLVNTANAAGFPSTGTGGITFSAGSPTDAQRDVGEPEVHVDAAGRIWTCGPSGFSNIADYAQVSTDGGDQFHLLGQPPRGQISAGEGGGDCGLATAPKLNSKGAYTFAYSGLGPLTNFSTGTSDDAGHTFIASPVSESPPGVDRQWLVFTDEKTVFLNFNQLVYGYTVQKSTDGGLTYGPAIPVGGGDGRIGPLRAILSPDGDGAKAIVYFPSFSGKKITLFRSMDGGTNWADCTVTDSGVDPSAGFVVADHDAAGNIYITYTAKGGTRDTFLTTVLANKVKDCTATATVVGTGKKIRVNRDAVETTVMPWVVAGDAGRVAVAFFGTDTVGNPDSGSIVASWYPYVSLTTNALATDPSWAQAKATAYPFHYGSICLGGLGCDLSIPKGDRSLADYFAMDISPTTGRLHVVYGSASKKPSDELGHVSTATVVNQETGPSLLASKTLTARHQIIRQETADPAGDALAPYSQLYVTPTPTNQAAMDVTNVTVGPEVDLNSGQPVANGGVTVTMKIADLTGASLQQALTGSGSQSLVYLFRFMNGFQPAGATAAWSPTLGWTFGFDDFETKATEAGQADPTAEKIIVWNQGTTIQGKVNENARSISLSIPRSLLRAQVGPTGDGQVPQEQGAIDGSVLFDGTVFTMANAFTATQAAQSYLYPVDVTAPMNFKVGTVMSLPSKTKGEGKAAVLGKKQSAPLPATGAEDDVALALVMVSVAAAGLLTLRRRTDIGRNPL